MHSRGASFMYIAMNSAISFCFSMLLTVELVYLAKIVRFTPLQLVLIGTVRQSVSFLFQSPTGVLADMYSRRWAVILGIFLTGVGYFVEGSIAVVAVVFAAEVVLGFGVTLMDGADTAWIADEIGVEQAGPIYLRAAQVGSFASLFGIALSAVLVNLRLNLPIILGGGLLIVLSIVLAVFMPEHHFVPIPREDRSTWQQMVHTFRRGVQMARLRPVLLTILSIAVFTGIFSAGFDQMWQYYLLHSFTFPALGGLASVTWFTLIEASIVVTNICGIEIARHFVDNNSHRSVALTLFMIDGLSVIGIIGFAVAGQFFLALGAFWLMTTVRGPRLALEQVWMNQNLDADVRATVFSLLGQIYAIAQIVGGPALGVIATTFSTRVALIASGLILLPTLLLYARTIRQVK